MPKIKNVTKLSKKGLKSRILSINKKKSENSCENEVVENILPNNLLISIEEIIESNNLNIDQSTQHQNIPLSSPSYEISSKLSDLDSNENLNVIIDKNVNNKGLSDIITLWV
jgi:hypothetical protein